METGSPALTLVLGGARSGKSTYAQRLAARADGKNVLFLATAQAEDDEMRAKIARHRKVRPSHWTTIEVPLDLDDAVTRYGNQNSLLLIDCLATFTSNLMTAEGGDEAAIFQRVDRLRSALVSTLAFVVVVSNEVGSGVVPAYQSGRQFRDLLGEINQTIAQISRNVILMIAGCPLALKGEVEIRL